MKGTEAVKEAWVTVNRTLHSVRDTAKEHSEEYKHRLRIALKSPIQAMVDPRHRCEDCKRVLTLHDFHAYWDGSVELERTGAVPRCCVWCAEDDSTDRFLRNG